MGGPQAMLGWVVALIIVLCDGMVWSELGAAMPGSGGSFGYLREAFGPATFGRCMGFLFVWQFVLSGPLEIASGYIGFARYLGYIWTDLTPARVALIVTTVGVLNIALLYRRIGSIATITVGLWIGTLIATAGVILTGALHFDRHIAFDVPPDAFQFSLGFLFGLGAASRVGVYDFLGYYDVCYIGDEVRNPGTGDSPVDSRQHHRRGADLRRRSTCRSSASCRGVSSCRPTPTRRRTSSSRRSWKESMARTIASVFTLLILWTAFGSVFALLLGYSRVPYAAAREGYFFSVFGRLHPTKGFPHVVAPRPGAARDCLQLLLARPGHRCADRDADSRPVRRPDRGCDPAAAPAGPG